MTVGELRELLEQYDEHQEVRLMTQAAYPFENEVLGVTSASEIHDQVADREHELTPVDPDADVVFIVEGRQLKYGSKAAWEVVQS